jgi:succinate dehydrogenase / fumarate reductase flavoprotein subunit
LSIRSPYSPICPAPRVDLSVLENLRFIPERDKDRGEQIYVRLEATSFVCETRPIRHRARDFSPFFERDWPDYLTGVVHDPSA